MNVIVYSSGCLPCTNKPLWKQLRAKAAEKRVLITRVDVSKSKEEREKAMSHNMDIPFVLENGVARSIDEWLS